MKKSLPLYLCLFAVWLTGTYAISADYITITSVNTPVTESFSGFMGTFASMPDGFRISKDGVTNMLDGDADFLGSASNSVTAGGCYAWSIGNSIAAGCQPTLENFTPGWLSAAVLNSTGKIIEDLIISYDITCRNNASRSSVINIETARADERFQTVPDLSFISPETADSEPTWIISHYSLHLALQQPLTDSEVFYIRWFFDDNSGGGSRDELGITNVSITLRKRVPTAIMIQ